MKVEDLPSYKLAFDHMPLQAVLLQVLITLRELRRRFGVIGSMRFLVRLVRKKRDLVEKYGEVVQERFAGVPASAIAELYTLSAIYSLLAESESKEDAYDFIAEIFHEIGPTAHASVYDVKRLKLCEGEIFRNFCKLNRAIFENSAGKGFYRVEEIQDKEHLQYVRLTKCLNVDAFSTLGCPELARLGCEIDRAGYAPEAIGDQVELDFRRPSAIAKGGASCEFYYYRKGHAPADMETL